MQIYKETVSFTASADSAALVSAELDEGLILAIETPDSFGATSLTIQVSDTLAGTYKTVVDYTNSPLTITVDGTTGKYIDLSDIFPVSLVTGIKGKFVKFKAGSSITKDIIVYTGGA